MRVLGVIPARMASQRFPGKPLQLIAGRSLVQRVWERAKQATLITELTIATEDQEIVEHARALGAPCVLTSNRAFTGTDRVAEVAAKFERTGKQFDLIANIQGDMPFINPAVVDRVIASLAESPPEFGMATPVTPITDHDEFTRPQAVKCVFSQKGRALYFSRSPIPFWRAAHPGGGVPWGHKHLGLYVFRAPTLAQVATLDPSPLEQAEGLEQLRALEHGIAIQAVPIAREDLEPSIEVDTPEDLARANAACGADSK